MTKYESLIHKSELCADAGFRSDNPEMKAIWYQKSQLLFNKAQALTVQEAEEIVDEN